MIQWPKRSFKITQPNTTGHQYLSLVCTYHKVINQQRINTSQPTEECMTTAITQVKIKMRAGIQIAEVIPAVLPTGLPQDTALHLLTTLTQRIQNSLNIPSEQGQVSLTGTTEVGSGNLSTSLWRILETLSQFQQNRKKNLCFFANPRDP